MRFRAQTPKPHLCQNFGFKRRMASQGGVGFRVLGSFRPFRVRMQGFKFEGLVLGVWRVTEQRP